MLVGRLGVWPTLYYAISYYITVYYDILDYTIPYHKTVYYIIKSGLDCAILDYAILCVLCFAGAEKYH